MTALLTASGLTAGYFGRPVVTDLDLTVEAGEVCALFGPNGAGKSTTLLALVGELPLLGGEVRLDGRPVTVPLHRRARNGLAFVSEERAIVRGLSVRDNLRVARADSALALGLFPELEPLLARRAGLLSGGEQQMLALARALGRRPRLLVVDELSLGLAPIVVQRLLAVLSRAARDDGVGVLLVEQHIRQALAIADRALVLRRGRVVLHGLASELAGRLDDIERAYLTANGAGPS